MRLAHGRDFAVELAKVFGIEGKNVRAITLRGDCRESASVVIEFIPTAAEVGMVTTIIKQYQLVQVEPVKTRHFDV